MGMLLSLCFVYAKQPSVSSRILAVLHKLSPWLWGTGLLCLFALVLWSYDLRFANTWPLFSNPLFYTYSYLVIELCLSLAFGLCLFALLFGSNCLKKPFEWSPLRRVGMISYSLYMWHLPFIFLFANVINYNIRRQGWGLLVQYGAFWCWVLIVVLPVSTMLYHWIEKPGMRLGELIICKLEGNKSNRCNR